jgi:hypothetical protein
LDWYGSGYGPVEGCCEHGNEPSGSIKCWEVLEWLHNWRLLKKSSAPWVSDSRSHAYVWTWKSDSEYIWKEGENLTAEMRILRRVSGHALNSPCTQ